MDVLIVEDEKPLRESMVDGLSEALGDLTVMGAGSVEEVERLLSSESPRLIISDVRLPGKGGGELLVFVRDRLPSTAFIFMSAYPSPEARAQASESGIQFLRKPFEFEALIEAVESALDQNQFSGELGGISLVDLLQVLNMGRRTAAVELERRGKAGRIFLSDGEIVHAEVGELSGREAFDRLMAWKGGSFGSQPGREAPARTITESFNGLLLDCFRAQDEQGEEADGGELSEDMFGIATSREAATDAGDALGAALEEALRGIPGCVSAGCVDISGATLVGLSPAGAVPEPVADLIPFAARAFMQHPALRKLDAALSGIVGAPETGMSTIREVIALSTDMTHHLLLEKGSEARAFVIVCRARTNLGTVVAKARAWLRTTPQSDLSG